MKDISAIVFTSNTGFTRRYAELLSRACALPAYDLAGESLPADGARVVYLGWLTAGMIKGLSRAKKRWRVEAVCAVGLSPENDMADMAKNNHVDCPLFYAQGGYAPEKLRGFNKLIMAAITGAIAKAQAKQVKTPEEATQLARLSRGCDFVDEANLAPLLSWLRGDGA